MQPLAPARLLHVIVCHYLAPVATPLSSACHCEPVRTLVWQSVLPAVKPSKLVLLQADPYALFRIRPKYYFLLCPAARRCGLPRRFAPRNDMQKHAACQHGNDVVPGEFAALFRIRRKYCPPPCPAARRCGLPRRFAPRNDRQKFALCPRLPGGTAGKRSCTRRNASVFSMSLRTSAHTGVAIRSPRREA